ncbi:MAG: DsbA family protein, partial [Actinomycetota bacterium]|nr:DsbA family protein [Actinomycetota bacterium]
RNIGDPEVLRELAREVGLDDDEVERVRAGDDYLERVRASTAQAQAIGISGIPAWLLDERLLLLGAQPRAVFEEAFERLSQP